MRYLLSILFLFIVVSCGNNSRIKDSEQQKKKIAEDSLKSNYKITHQFQDSTNILGDKIIISGKKDENGFLSPDTILILGEFDDSITAIKAMGELSSNTKIMNSRNYYYLNKSASFIIYNSIIADSNLYNNYNKAIIYRMRPNNFKDDMNLTPNLLEKAYSNYKVEMLDTLNNIYLIHPTKEYTYARMFVRLVKYTPSGKQLNSVTINDFNLANGNATNNGYVLALNNFGYGASSFFVKTHYSFKIIWLDKNLKITGSFQLSQPGTKIVSVDYKDKKCIAAFEMHLGCDACEWDFCKYDIVFNKKYQPVDIVIWEQPRGKIIPADTLLLYIKRLSSEKILEDNKTK